MIDLTIKCTNVALHLQVSNFAPEYLCSFYFYYFYFICHCIDRPTDYKYVAKRRTPNDLNGEET